MQLSTSNILRAILETTTFARHRNSERRLINTYPRWVSTQTLQRKLEWAEYEGLYDEGQVRRAE